LYVLMTIVVYEDVRCRWQRGNCYILESVPSLSFVRLYFQCSCE